MRKIRITVLALVLAALCTATALAAGTQAVGDVNGSGDVDMTDMQCLYELLSTDKYSGSLTDEAGRRAADINGDGAVDILDYQRLYDILRQQEHGGSATVDAQYALGWDALQNGKFASGAAYFDAAIKLESKSTKAYVGLAECYEGQHDLENAKKTLQRGIDAGADKRALQDKIDEINSYSVGERVRAVTLFDSEGRVSQRTSYKADGSVNSSYDIEYMADGTVRTRYRGADGYVNLITDSKFRADGRLVSFVSMAPNKRKMYSSEHTYSDDGKIIQSEYCNYDYTSGEVTWRQVQVYNEQELVIASTEYGDTGDITGKTEYEYSSAGKLTKETYYNRYDKVNCVIEYDGEGNKTRSTSYSYYPGDTLQGYEVSEYSAAGQVIRTIMYNADDTINERVEYDYNAAGQILCKRIYRSWSTEPMRVEYEYNAEGTRTRALLYETDSEGSEYHLRMAVEYDTTGENIATATSYDSYKVGQMGTRWELNNDGIVTKIENYTYNAYDDTSRMNLVEYDSTGENIRHIRYFYDEELKEAKYDENGVIAEWTEYWNHRVGLPDGHAITTYEGGIPTEERCYYEGDNVPYRINKFSSDGNLARAEYYNDEGGALSAYTVYTYNEAENRYEGTEYNADGTVKLDKVYEDYSSPYPDTSEFPTFPQYQNPWWA